MVNKAKEFLGKTDSYKIFIVVIGILITGVTTNMAFSLNRLVKELDLNTVARHENAIVDARQREKINTTVKNVEVLKCEVKDIDKRVVRLESK